MVGAGMRPGCLVSVSLISLSSDQLDGFPLDNLFEECKRFFGLDVDNDLLYGEAGRTFVVATVFPSREVQKNCVKLSWDLACVLGCPSVGRLLFISTIYTHQTPKHSDGADILRVIKCKNLYLSLVPPEVGSASSNESESDCCPERNEMVMETCKKIPSAPLHRKESLYFSFNSGSSMCLDQTTARSALADEEVNELLQTSAQRCLNEFVDGSAQGDLCKKGNTLSTAEDSANLGKTLVSFLVDRTTKVHLSDSFCTEKLRPDKLDLPLELECDKRNEVSNHAPMLGGYKGVLLYGPPGTGKTSLASSCAYDAGANLFTVNGPEIISNYYGESEQSLYDVFSSAKKAAPAVVFIDELDAIAPSRKEGSEELSIRMVVTLLKLMDEIGPSDCVLLIAVTNRPDSIDPALWRSGRLDKEIEIGVPSAAQRMDILRHLLIEVHHFLSNEELESIALAIHGFVGADLAALCNEAALIALRRFISLGENSSLQLGQPDSSVDKCIRDTGHPGYQESSLSLSTMSLDDCPSENRNNTKISKSYDEKDEKILLVNNGDFQKAQMKIRPSAMREVMLEVPKVRWEDVGGQASIKEQLIEAIQLPQKYPEAFERLGIKPPSGLLMIGPPGCSKTLMARAAASEAKLNFLAVKGPELFSKWVGDSEKAVRSLFAKARANAPAILFFDEIDGFAVTRGLENDGTSVADRVLCQLLVEIDGLDQRVGVTVIAATNRPDKIDPALLRTGRFDTVLDVQPPNKADRADIFQIHTRSMPCSPDVNLKDLARLTEGYTGAEIKLVCREAAVAALDESFDLEEVAMRHFKSAISSVKPSDVEFYQKLAKDFRRYVDGGAPPRKQYSRRCSYSSKLVACGLVSSELYGNDVAQTVFWSP
ncbi:unnamed protein product [Miscanthus lutarioriparius]|uniref:AAA+ ATPase domain-containing protein n=1 Tax=Miscanthus lutarioriparius TaxID=422564 RepID=A0A811MHB6_9POAL|nr:unnamed protein product [Miscanthus lutarioriparius]